MHNFIDVLWLILVLTISFILLSLSLARHYSDVTKQEIQLSQRAIWLFRLSGYCLLLAAIALAINFWGISLGLVYWFGSMTLVTALLSMVLTYRPQYLLCISVLVTIKDKTKIQ